MRRTSLAAMLTLLAVLAATLAVAGCGGKTSSSQTQTTGTTTTGTTTVAPHKHSTKPAY
jgi:ABC-type glycerol-3-phosphate transport system substrate-binding protein